MSGYLGIESLYTDIESLFMGKYVVVVAVGPIMVKDITLGMIEELLMMVADCKSLMLNPMADMLQNIKLNLCFFSSK